MPELLIRAATCFPAAHTQSVYRSGEIAGYLGNIIGRPRRQFRVGLAVYRRIPMPRAGKYLAAPVTFFIEEPESVTVSGGHGDSPRVALGSPLPGFAGPVAPAALLALRALWAGGTGGSLSPCGPCGPVAPAALLAPGALWAGGPSSSFFLLAAPVRRGRPLGPVAPWSPFRPSGPPAGPP